LITQVRGTIANSDLPGPKTPCPLFTFMAFRRRPIEFLSRAAQEYGDLVYFRFGPQPVFFLNHPDLIRDVLVTYDHCFRKGRGLERAKRLLGEGLLTSEDDFHRRQRRLVQPAFHRQRVQSYGVVMSQYVWELQQSWTDGAVMEIDQEMMRLTLSIVAKTLFDTDVSGEAGEIGRALTTAMQLWRRMMSPFAEYLEKLPLPANRKFEKTRQQLDAIIYGMIEKRRGDGRDHGDLLSMLLSAQDSEGEDGRMNDLQLRDELLTLFLAGHETTAKALTWTWYLLSSHPEVEAKLHAELDRALAGRLPEVDDLPRLNYAERVLAESMRLYPPAWIIGRRAVKDCDLPRCRIPAGALVLLSQYIMHHDARFFPDPLRFDPERWTPEAKGSRPKFSYFPFGGGSRQCIGESFAWMEGTLLLATLAQRWRMRLIPGHPVALEPLVTLRPKFGMKMKLERR
jgi:cytochrome P450